MREPIDVVVVLQHAGEFGQLVRLAAFTRGIDDDDVVLGRSLGIERDHAGVCGETPLKQEPASSG